jgi:hypothetical protein
VAYAGARRRRSAARSCASGPESPPCSRRSRGSCSGTARVLRSGRAPSGIESGSKSRIIQSSRRSRTVATNSQSPSPFDASHRVGCAHEQLGRRLHVPLGVETLQAEEWVTVRQIQLPSPPRNFWLGDRILFPRNSSSRAKKPSSRWRWKRPANGAASSGSRPAGNTTGLRCSRVRATSRSETRVYRPVGRAATGSGVQRQIGRERGAGEFPARAPVTVSDMAKSSRLRARVSAPVSSAVSWRGGRTAGAERGRGEGEGRSRNAGEEGVDRFAVRHEQLAGHAAEIRRQFGV